MVARVPASAMTHVHVRAIERAACAPAPKCPGDLYARMLGRNRMVIRNDGDGPWTREVCAMVVGRGGPSALLPLVDPGAVVDVLVGGAFVGPFLTGRAVAGAVELYCWTGSGTVLFKAEGSDVLTCGATCGADRCEVRNGKG